MEKNPSVVKLAINNYFDLKKDTLTDEQIRKVAKILAALAS